MTADSVAIRVCPTPCQPCAFASPQPSVSIAWMPDALENRDVGTEAGDQRLRIHRPHGGQQGLGVDTGRQQVAALHRDAVDVTSEGVRDGSGHLGDVGRAEVDHRHAALSGGDQVGSP